MQRALQESRLQDVSRLSKDDFAEGHRGGGDRGSRSLARNHREFMPARHKKDIYGEKAVGQDDCRATEHRQSGQGKRLHLANRFLAAVWQREFS